jgi:hypothetical protein
VARSRPRSPNNIRAWNYCDFARQNFSGCVDSSRKSDPGSGFRVYCADSDDRSGIAPRTSTVEKSGSPKSVPGPRDTVDLAGGRVESLFF